MNSGTQTKIVTKHFNQLNQNHNLIFLVDGSELRESFSTGLGHKHQNKKCPKGANTPVYETEDILELKSRTNRNRCIDAAGDSGNDNRKEETNPWKKKTACNPRELMR